MPADGNRICVLRGRRFNPFFALAEASWVLAGRNDVHSLKHYLPDFEAFSDDGVTLNGAYGYRARSHFGQDQLEEAVTLLRRDPTSRRAVILLWDATDLRTDSKDLPCNVAVFVKTRGDHLDLTVCNRSNDLYLGVPYNVVTFAILHQYIAARLNVNVGSQLHFTDSLHVYEKDREKIIKIVNRNDEKSLVTMLQGHPLCNLKHYATKNHSWLISNPSESEDTTDDTSLLRNSYILWKQGHRYKALRELPLTDAGYAAAMWFGNRKHDDLIKPWLSRFEQNELTWSGNIEC
jgi:hypothetical protein